MNTPTIRPAELFLSGRRYPAVCLEYGDGELSLELPKAVAAQTELEFESGRLVGLGRDGGFMAAEMHSFEGGPSPCLRLRLINRFVVPLP